MTEKIPLPPGGAPAVVPAGLITPGNATMALAHKFTLAASSMRVEKGDVIRAAAIMMIQAIMQCPEASRRPTLEAIVGAIRKDVLGEDVIVGSPLSNLILPR